MSDITTDTAFPIWTEVINTSTTSGGASPSGRVPRGDTSLATLSEVLGWRVNTTDATGIRRALDDAFSIARGIDGHSVVSWNPRGLRMQSGSSGTAEITGSQRSLKERTDAIVAQIRPLLDHLMPLKAAPDWEDVHAIQTQIGPALDELAQQFAEEGGPVVQRVDNVFELLMDYDPKASDPKLIDAQHVKGLLGLLRHRLGLSLKNVNTVREELQLTQFETLVNYIDMLRLTWHQQRDNFAGDSDAFLGTQTVLIERALSCVDESIDEVLRAMDSVFVGPIERATINIGTDEQVTIEELLRWIDDVASVRGFEIIATGGKDGIIHVLVPTLCRLRDLLAEANAYFAKQKAATSPEVPRALLTNRVLANLEELHTHLDNALRLSAEVHRGDAACVKKIHVGDLCWTGDAALELPAGTSDVQLQIRGSYFRRNAEVRLVQPGQAPIKVEALWRDPSCLAAKIDVKALQAGPAFLQIINDKGVETTTAPFVNITK